MMEAQIIGAIVVRIGVAVPSSGGNRVKYVVVWRRWGLFTRTEAVALANEWREMNPDLEQAGRVQIRWEIAPELL